MPGKITNVRIVLQSLPILTIDWDAPEITGDLPFSRYLVRTDEADYVLGSPIDNGASLSFSKSITQPGNEGRIFRFRIAVENSLGTSVYSDEIQLMST